MKIRRGKELSLRGFFPGYDYVHFCLLNKSPWDVTTSDDDQPAAANGGSIPSTPPAPPPPQFEGDKIFTGNGSLGDSMGATNSVNSLNSDERVAADMMVNLVINCNDMKKSDKAIKGDEEFKFELKKATRKRDNDNAAPSKRAAEKKPRLARRKRPRAARRGSTSGLSSNPHEYYYYSGFGPTWGKKRGGGEGNSKTINVTNNVENNNSNVTSSKKKKSSRLSSSSSSYQDYENEYIDFLAEEDEEESRPQKMRKPVKERSLKSLM